MADAVQVPARKYTYLQFFGLEKPPFARLPGPSTIYHSEQYSLLMDALAVAKAAPDNLVVLRGADGSGKSTLINRYLSCLDEDETVVKFDDSCTGSIDFYCAFFGQIGFRNIDGKLDELRKITNEFLVHRVVNDDPVLLVVDNAHDMHPAVFDELRWHAAVQYKGRRVFSIVLAGNARLGHLLDSPAVADLTFRKRVDFHIRAYTEAETAEYILYRLMLAGIDDRIAFTPEALALVYRFTAGIPRRINRLCAMLLSEARDKMTHDIDDTLVRAVAEAAQLPANVFPKKHRSRRKTDGNSALSAEIGQLKADKAALASRLARAERMLAINAREKEAMLASMGELEQLRELAADQEPDDAAIRLLRVVLRGKVERIHEISADDPYIMIGRGKDCDLQLKSKHVSRHHALVVRKGAKTYIEDLKSFNGTIVNGTRVTRCDLNADDAVLIGEFRIEPAM